MALLANAQCGVASAPGTGTVALGSATPGSQSWAAAGAKDGVTYSYRIEEGQSWEIGQGQYTATGAKLSRGLIASSTGSLVAFGAAAIVSQVALPQDLRPTTAGTAGGTLNDFAQSPTWTEVCHFDFVATGALVLGWAALSYGLRWNGDTDVQARLVLTDLTAGTLVLNGNPHCITLPAASQSLGFSGNAAPNIANGVVPGNTHRLALQVVKSASAGQVQVNSSTLVGVSLG